MSLRSPASFSRTFMGLLLGVWSGLYVTNLWAATCTRSEPAPASWHTPSHWSGCAGGNGVPAGTPGPADLVILPSGTGKALLDSQFTTVAQLQIAAGAELGVVETQIDLRQLTVTSSLSISNAILSGALPPPGGPSPALLSVQLPAGSSFSVNGTNTFRRASVTNAGTATFNGGSGVRLDFDLNGQFVNAASGVTTVLGGYVFGYTTSGAVDNQGTWVNQGPGLVKIERSGASGGQFFSTGLFEIHGGTFKLLNPPADFQAGFNSSIRLRDGIFDGGVTGLVITPGKFFNGNGTVIGPFRSSGLLDLEASDGGPFGVLNVLGNAQFQNGDIVFDVGGTGATQHDRFSISGSVQWNRANPRVRMLGGYAPGIDTGIAIATHASRISPELPVHDRVLSDYPLSLALRPTPTQTDLRVVPTLTLADTAIIEGNSGSQTMQIAATLSAPTTETVSFGYTTSPGTAVSSGGGGNPADYTNALGSVSFAPGVVSRHIPVTIKGDVSVEADEAFALVTDDASNSSTLQNASFGNNRRFSTRAEGLIRDDDSAPDTRYLLIGKSTNQATPTGQISYVRRYTTSGVAVDGWATLMPSNFGANATGFCRAPNGDVLSTRFSVSQGPVLMSPAGAVLDPDFGGLIGYDESCAFDALGNVWVGEAAPTPADVALLRYVSADGLTLETYEIPVGERGTDWIELDSNQCTLYYTSEDSDVRRFDVCSGQVLSHFATGLEEPCYALRQLPNHDLMVTCRNRIYRYEQNGLFVREYTRESLGETDKDGLYAIQLDPDGETFWTGGVVSGRVVRANLDSGSVVTSFTTGTGGINGLLVQDEFVAAIPDVIFEDGFEP
ncbi:MAG: hypothetical protein IPP82_00290 [Xanthomonadales bacterium]|nr:hypothetical protein [Xanthomonadales bacterium]